ncbi:hypothetical protein FRC02_002975 [Tulasnella sp. 418]|nr:hypothetical protein FRC02_002975 [Tulasnella sp. 418]
MVVLPESVVNEALAVLMRPTILTPESMIVEEYEESPLESSTIHQLEKEANTIEKVSEAFMYAVQNRVATLRRRRNELVLINRLPNEILSLIIELAGTAIFYHHYPDMLSISQVCSRWHTIFLSTPKMWTRVISSCDIEFVKIILQRSKHAPLDIEYCFTYSRDEFQFLRAIIPHASRWRSFRNIGNAIPTFPDDTPQSLHMPLLESIQIAASADRPKTFPSIFLHDSPRLSSLIIPGFELPLGCSAFSHLRSIHFRAVRDGSLLDLQQWEDFLSSVPELEYIHADGSPNAVLGEIGFPFEVHMEKLERLELSTLPSGLIGALIRSIHTTQPRYPVVSIANPTDSSSDLLSIFPPSAPTRSLLGKIREMTLLYASCFNDSSCLFIRAETQENGKLLTFRGQAQTGLVPNALDRLISPAGCSSLRYVEVNGAPFFRGTFLGSWLMRCHNVRSIVALEMDDELGPDARDSNMHQFCLDLSTSGSAGSSWPCPNLTHLEVKISNRRTLSSITQFMQCRYTMRNVATPSSIEYPGNLEQLVLVGPYDQTDLRGKYPQLVKRLKNMCGQLGTEFAILSDYADDPHSV